LEWIGKIKKSKNKASIIPVLFDSLTSVITVLMLKKAN